MSTDGKPVSFVTQILQIKSYRRLKRQSETFFVFHMVKLFSGITFRPLGYGEVKVFQAFMHRIQLPAPAVEQNNVRTVACVHPCKTTAQHLFHHCKVIIGDF